MRTILVAIFMLCALAHTRAQTFTLRQSISLPATVEEAQVDWVDLNNDEFLDVVLLTREPGGSYLHFLKGAGDGLTLLPGSMSVLSVNAYVIADYNKDNKMDIIVSGMKDAMRQTSIYVNNGEFNFTEVAGDLPPFEMIKFADLSNNGSYECIVSGEENGNYYTRILEQIGGTWKVMHDSLKINLSAVEIIDVDGNGQFDLFMSGRVSSDSAFTGFFLNKGNYYLAPHALYPWIGKTFLADINNDGLFDIAFTGTDENGAPVSKFFIAGQKTYATEDADILLREARPFAGDLNSDGRVDFNLLGRNSENDTLNILQYGDNAYDTLPHEKLVTQRFGDLEHDGDLDLLQVINDGPLSLVYYENSTETLNEPPGNPTNAIAIAIFNRLFFYWDKPLDDHTPVESLTFDLYLEGQNSSQAAEFDLMNDKRLTVSHGNNGTENFRLLKATGAMNFSIQAVDNAFHAGASCVGSGGGGGGGSPCASVKYDQLGLCRGESIDMQGPEDARWFSFATGYLGQGASMHITAAVPDTLFYYSPAARGCSGLQVWTIDILKDAKKVELLQQYACAGSMIEFKVEEEWDSVSWESGLHGDLGSAPLIQYTATAADSIIATLVNSEGCTVIRKTALKVSKPDLTVEEAYYEIVKGGSVQLSASGALGYEWSPSEGLDKVDIPNPIAHPSETTQYTVTGYDSLGCQDKAIVMIVVESSGFIPNLFTPNDDGKNDKLQVYGLASADDFSFTIYNREGNVVYRTNLVHEAMQNGWDGTTAGIKQPNGVYFWNVKGTIGAGDPLLLNGKEKGSIVLIR